MADNLLMFDGDTPAKKVTFEDDVSSTGSDTSDGNDDDLMNDASGNAEDPNDDDFRLDGFGDLGIPSDKIEPEVDDQSEDDNKTTSTKRKHAHPSANSKLAKSPRRSFNFTRPGDEEAFILEDNNAVLTKLSSRVPGTFGRHNRRKGESLPAYHKRVSHELDSDDELMMQMRENGFSDRQIADKLAKDGRIRYDQKSISTRIMRIRLAQADNVDFLLKEGYKEWEIDDDKALIQAYALADIEVNYEMERVRAWRFRKVSEYMRRLNGDSLFSATACRERYNALVSGNARIPIEEDDDPDTRRSEMEAYRTSREQIRIKEKAEKEAKEADEEKAKQAAKSSNAQKAEELANLRAIKEAEKAERAMARAASAQMRANRAIENSLAKTQRNSDLKKRKQAAEETKNLATATTKTTLTNKPVAFNLPAAKDATEDTPDPRSYLSVDDLVHMCEDRGLDLPRQKNMETLVEALRDADDEFSQKDLQKMCRAKKLNANVSKLTMKYQLALSAAQSCASFQARAVAAAGGKEGEEMVDADVD